MTEEEAFEMGARCAMPHQGPKSPLQKWMEETCEGAVGIPVHPLSKELLEEAFERVPEHLHASLAKGFMTKLIDLAENARKTGRN
jgi:hypothetical protein